MTSLVTRTTALDTQRLLKTTLFVSAHRVSLVIKLLKGGKASSDHEIRFEVLKALNRRECPGLTRVCQVAWNFGRKLRTLANMDHQPVYMKSDKEECTHHCEMTFLSLLGKASDMKGKRK